MTLTVDDWKRHFINMAKGTIRPDINGNWKVTKQHHSSDNPHENRTTIKIVSPTQQAVNQAKEKVIKRRKVVNRETAKRKQKKITSSVPVKKKKGEGKITVFDTKKKKR